MQGYSRHTQTGRGNHAYFIELWRQPWYRRAAAVAYHWYDMRIYKVPGFTVISRLHRWAFGRERREDDFYIPLTNRQDLRCHRLVHRGRVTLATIEVPEATYNALAKPDST